VVDVVVDADSFCALADDGEVRCNGPSPRQPAEVEAML